MRVELARDNFLLESNGNWAPAEKLIGERELIAFNSGQFVPVKALITFGQPKHISTYRSGSYRYISPASPIELLDQNRWRDIRTFYTDKKLSTHHVLKHNQIIVPRHIPIFGETAPEADWIEAIARSAIIEQQLVIPDFLVHLNRDALQETLRQILVSAYPNIRIHKGGFIKKTKTIRLTRIEERSRRLLTHLLARFGVRVRRNEYQSLQIRDNLSKEIMANILGFYRSRALKIDTTMKDWIWVHYPRGLMETVVVETEADNICDGLFIWRQSRLD